MLNKSGVSLASAPVSARQYGVTLIEAVLFIVISLGLIVGGIIFFQQANLASRVNDTLRVVTGIQSETRALFASQSTFGADNDPLNLLLIQSGAVPTSILGGTPPALVNAWGGGITVTGDGNEFTVALAGIPVAACARISAVDANGTGPAGVGITEVSITNDTTTLAHVVATATAPLSPTLAATACANGDDATATVAWTFTR